MQVLTSILRMRSDLKEIRQYALWGAMHVVLPNWLEECSLQKREIVVSEKYAVAHTLLVQENLFRQGIVPNLLKVLALG